MNYALNYSRQDPLKDNNFGSYTQFIPRNNLLTDNLYSQGVKARGEMVPLGYDDIFDAISRIFRVGFFADSTSYVILKLPVFAKIDTVELDGKKIRIDCRYHKNLGDLFLRYETKNYPDIEPVTYDQSKGKFKEENDFEYWQLEVDSVPLEHSRDDIFCEVTLFVKSLSVDVSFFRRKFAEMISEKKLLDANPLAKIFNRFCSIDELQKLFSEAEVHRSKLDVSDYFERTVGWLFSLCGFQSIWLGNDFQVTRSSKSVNLGSADIICYNSSKRILPVVSCKIGQIPDNAIDGIRNLSKILEEELKELGIEVVPIIVSAKAAYAIKQKAKDLGVHVIDGDDLKIILQKLYEGPANPDLLLKPLNDKVGFRNSDVHFY